VSGSWTYQVNGAIHGCRLASTLFRLTLQSWYRDMVVVVGLSEVVVKHLSKLRVLVKSRRGARADRQSVTSPTVGKLLC